MTEEAINITNDYNEMMSSDNRGLLAAITSFGKSIGLIDDSVNFVTKIKIHQEMVRWLSSITYFYNPNWAIDFSLNTLPVGFFVIEKYRELSEAEITQNAIMFYNSGLLLKQDNCGLMDVANDNVIVKPKIYSMRVYCPNNLNNYEHANFGVATSERTLRELAKSKNDRLEYYTMATLESVHTSAKLKFKQLLTALSVSKFKINNIELGMNRIVDTLFEKIETNKNSIDAMKGQIIGFKSHKSVSRYDKAGVIQKIEWEEDPTIQGWTIGDIIFQEVNVLTLRNFNSLVKQANPISSARNIENIEDENMADRNIKQSSVGALV